MKYCKHCGAELVEEAVVCPKCGCSVEEKVAATTTAQKHHPCGIAGFVCSLTGLVLSWLGWVTFILLAAGFVLSIVGICLGKKNGQKTSLAIAGLVLSLVDLVVAIIIIVAAAALLAAIWGSASALALVLL